MFSLENKYIIVNYHYVEDPNPKFSGIFPCSLADFEKQIKFLSENYKIVSVPEVFEAAQANENGKFCAIAFDDGLRGQYRNALPILKKYGAFGIFFPITSVFEGRLPVAHKVHILLSKVPADQMADVFNNYMEIFYPDLKDQYFLPKDRRLTSKRMHEEPVAANFKEMLIMLPDDIKGRFLRHCFKNFHLNEKKYSQNLFMSKEEIKDLIAQGQMVGNHSHHHYAFDVINEEAMRAEIKLSNEILADLLGSAPKIFSYPHGRHNEVSEKVLRSEGFDFALTIENRDLNSNDKALAIPRFDTNDIKGYIH